MSFADMENAKIGVEATAYLQHMIEEPPAHEPLLAALGGEPIALKHNIERELDNWAANKMTPLFVFEGQSTVGSDEVALVHAAEALKKTRHAWDLYSDNEPGDAVKTFGGSCNLVTFFNERNTNFPQVPSDHKTYIESSKRYSSSVKWTS